MKKWTVTATLLALTGCAAEIGGAPTPSTLSRESLGTDRPTPSSTLDLPVSDLIGAAVMAPPEHVVVEREPYLLDGSLGFTLWDPGNAAEDVHSTTPLVRVSLALETTEADVEARVAEKLEEYGPHGAHRSTVEVSGQLGIAVGPIPGSPPSTEIWVPTGGHVYRVNVFGEAIDEVTQALLARVELTAPSQSLFDLDLLDANEETLLYIDGAGSDGNAFTDPKRELTSLFDEVNAEGVTSSALTYGRVIHEGCYEAPWSFWVQTQHGWGANGTGWVRVGSPNYWGEYTHGSLGWGRCASPHYTNDKFAIDYPMRRGDVLFSPFWQATVTYAGRHLYYKNYGIFVALADSNGEYANLSAHLNGLARGIHRGATVYHTTIIGYAGNTGHPSIPVGPVHLHQAFYRYPSYHWFGAPFGGRGLAISYFRYVGTAAGNGGGGYPFTWPAWDDRSTVTKGEWISN